MAHVLVGFSQTNQSNSSFMNASFAPYIGTGTLPFTVDLLPSIQLLLDSPSGGSRFFNSDSSSGNIYLEYTYTPATLLTPEPASGILFLIAGAVTTVMRKRK